MITVILYFKNKLKLLKMRKISKFDKYFQSFGFVVSLLEMMGSFVPQFHFWGYNFAFIGFINIVFLSKVDEKEEKK